MGILQTYQVLDKDIKTRNVQELVWICIHWKNYVSVQKIPHLY